MHDWASLSHVRWDCKYHIVFVPKYRKKKLYGKFRKQVGVILKNLSRQRGVELLEGHLIAKIDRNDTDSLFQLNSNRQVMRFLQKMLNYDNDHFVPELHQANFQLLFFFFQT